MNAIIPLDFDLRRLGLRGRLTMTGWSVPDNVGEQEWELAGDSLAKIGNGIGWWLGDWWNSFKPAWGERRMFFERHPDWPAYRTISNCATVSSAFDISRRREVLTWQHHAEVVGEPEVDQESLLDWCTENPGKQRSARELRGEMWRRRRIESGFSTTAAITRLDDLFASGQKFGCIYADPPWLYDNQATRSATVGAGHYEGLTVDQLCSEEPYCRIGKLAAEDAHLHLWITNAFLFSAPRIFEAWGFEFRSTFVWVKTSIGIGNYWRNSHEILLTAIRGDAKRFNDKTLKSWIEVDRGKHSAKPEQVRAMLESASPGPFLEVFGRRSVENWTVWGNEVQLDLLSPTGGK